ncbi:Mor transcription activator family protein [Variovorax sp. V116]|uniref:Mor transcription activator family protein n=1 Tax=Variovorax sp. V116 TaxID=3065953 RepID=UPI0034E87D93
MTEPHSSDEPLAIIEEEARAMAQCFGVAAPDEAAASLMDRILLRLGGEHIYFPRRSSKERQRVHAEIVSKFNGSNLFELARQYEMSPRHIRRILAALNRSSMRQ